MRMEKKREAELAKRKGTTGRTIIATIWLILSFVAAYYVTGWLMDSGTVDMSFFYNKLLIPRSVDEGMIRAGFTVVIVAIVQFFVLIGFAFASPAGRFRPGTPTAISTNPDPTESHFDYR